jgi:hypothetical protein
VIFFATHTADGRELSATEREQSPLLGCIDQPAQSTVYLADVDSCRVSGWVVSTRGRSARVRIELPSQSPIEYPTEELRPDVVKTYSERYGICDPRCGFEFDLDVGGYTGEVPVRVAFTDGQFVGYAEPFRIVRPDDAAVLDRYVPDVPSNRTAIEIFAGEWTSKLPGDLAEMSGSFDAFDDERIRLAVEALGGIEGQRVLELGPLEGGHTWMLEHYGAAEVVAVEGNTRAYLKCLIVKEALGLQRSRFLCGDFVAYLRHSAANFDVIVASGVLYHIREPLELIDLIARRTDRIVLWTHYYDRDAIHSRPALERFKTAEIERTFRGRRYRLYPFTYGMERTRNTFCGGSQLSANWLSRRDLLGALRAVGFTNQVIAPEYDEPDHSLAPALLVTAWK